MVLRGNPFGPVLALLGAILVVAAPVSCSRREVRVGPPAEQGEVREEIAQFSSWWLAPARVAPPSVEFVEKTVADGALVGRALPVRPEDAAWNQWPGPEYRLFNNRAALLFEVEVRGEGRLRWLPERSKLELNEEGQAVAPAATPDELLGPLLVAARVQERSALDGDLVARTRAAGPFRARYLPLSEERGALRGLIAFPLEDAEQHVVALRLTLGVQTEHGPRTLRWDFD